ncbi:hypothetical protein [uncultured Roseobacter sp.]|nr:hypothetical protein [uncultured Roseobacter sp.]
MPALVHLIAFDGLLLQVLPVVWRGIARKPDGIGGPGDGGV